MQKNTMMQKPNKDKTAVVVMSVCLSETIKSVPVGKTVRFTRSELPVKEMSVYSACARLNAKLPQPVWEYKIENNGDIIITHR